LDDVNVPTLKYDDKPKIVLEPKAETNRKRLKYISVEDEAKKYKGNSIFKYFLDGSRKTYKVDDIAIGERIYPINRQYTGNRGGAKVSPATFP
jgi:hypothetical protein